MSRGRPSQREVAERIGASPATLRRWVRQGLVPQYAARDGWTPAAVRNATVVARMRARGHSFSEIRSALEEGRLAYAYTEELLTAPGRIYKLDDAARETGLEPALAERIMTTAGFNTGSEGALREEDVQLLRYAARGLEAGLPLVALRRIGIHLGNAIYRDGDYFGRDVNISARVAARSAGGEVLVTRPVVESAGSHLEFDRIGEIKLKGFSVSTEMFVARLNNEEE